MRRVFAIEQNCIGCRLCEVACLVEHSESKNMVIAMREENPRQTPYIRVEALGASSLALQCRHCVEPLCVYSCLTQALTLREDGTVTYNGDYCIGCWTCMLACPYGAISFNAKDPKKIAKCDLCPDREVPACVAVCPNEALVFAEDLEVRQKQSPRTLVGAPHV